MESIQVSAIIPASAEQVYNDWLNKDKHSAFTGGEANIRKKAGAKFTAWDDYIEGTILELEEGERILMHWRTAEFPKDADYSTVEILLSDLDGDCEIIINHTEIPSGQGEKYEDGWVEHYFEPMKRYYMGVGA